MKSLADLCSDVRATLSAFEPFLNYANKSAWTPKDGFLPLVTRAIAIRQSEALAAIVDLAEMERGYAAVPLLRAACEEFIWIKYLHSISQASAEELVRLLASSELLASLEAQDKFAGRTMSDGLGLTVYLARLKPRSAQTKSALKRLALELKWDKRTIDSGKPPSVAFLAKHTGKKKVYDYLYHATSRYVHFSPAELLRRAWGKTGDVSIRSSHFNNYWAAFALYWGTSLLARTFRVVSHMMDTPEDAPQIDGGELLAASKGIVASGAIPIITAEELAWEK